MGLRCIYEIVLDISIFFLTILGFLIFIPILGIFLVWKSIWFFLASTVYRTLALESFGPEDVLMYSIENCDIFYQGPGKCVMVTFVVDGQLEENETRQMIQTKVLSHCQKNGQLTFSRLQKKLVRKFGYLGFGHDENFNVENHIRSVQMSLTEDSVPNFIVNQSKAPFPENSPMWEILLVQNYNEQNQTFGLFRFNHVYMDGVSALRFAEICWSTGGEFESKRSTTSKELPRKSMTLASLYKNTIRIPRQYWLEQRRRKWSKGQLNSQNETYQKLVQNFSLEDFKKLKERSGIRFTEAILTAASYATTAANVTTLPVVYAVPLSNAGEAVGNNYGLAEVTLPSGPMPLPQRIQACQEAIRKGFDTVSPKVDGALLLLGIIIPPKIFRILFQKLFNFDSFLFSNMPGPIGECQVMGHRFITTYYSCLPNPNPQVDLAIISYNGSVNICMSGSSVLFKTKANFYQFVESFEFCLKSLLYSKTLTDGNFTDDGRYDSNV